MTRPFDHVEPGTDEAVWRAAALWNGRPPLDLDVDHLIVLAAHPDDETLGAGGLLAAAERARVAVTVVIATDGERSPDTAGTGIRRRDESARALSMLAPSARVVFLGLPDGELREYRAQLARDVAAVVPRNGRTLIAATWWGDGHRDHRIVGEVAQEFAAPRVRVVGYPIWLWHWGDPGDIDPATWEVIALDPADATAKSAAIAAHASQVEGSAGEPPMLHGRMQAHFLRDVEVFIPAVAADAGASTPSVDVAEFDAFISRHDDPWGFESRWYEQRKRALLMAALPSTRARRALELGCATGLLTAELVTRADTVVAVDGSAEALRRAARRVDDGRVEFVLGVLPRDWPTGPFDLIVLSEIAYYFSDADQDRALAEIDAGLTADGALVACHWRHKIEGAPSDGDAVHARIARHAGLARAARYEEPDVVLEVFTRPDTPSLATREGLR